MAYSRVHQDLDTEFETKHFKFTAIVKKVVLSFQNLNSVNDRCNLFSLKFVFESCLEGKCSNHD